MMVFKLASPAAIVDAGFDWQDKGIALIWSALRIALEVIMEVIMEVQECLSEGQRSWCQRVAPHRDRHGGSLMDRLE